MKKLYHLMRVIGYVSGLLGLGLYLFGGGSVGEGNRTAQAGALLLAVMFLSLFISYGLFGWMKITRRKR